MKKKDFRKSRRGETWQKKVHRTVIEKEGSTLKNRGGDHRRKWGDASGRVSKTEEGKERQSKKKKKKRRRKSWELGLGIKGEKNKG